VKVATPEPFTLLVACGVPSIINVTVSVGTPDAGGAAATVAVNVTDCPNTEGFTEEVTLVVVLA